MISAGWRRLGISPPAVVIVGLAAIALLLSRGAGSGWLVVVAAVFLGGFVLAALSALVGIADVAVSLDVPTDAHAGETVSVGVHVSGGLPQLRTVTLLTLDQSTHAVESSGHATVGVVVGRRGLVTELPVEVRAGLPLGLVRTARRFRLPMPTPLAIAPVPATVSLLDTLGEDPTAEVRGVRAYTPGDPARLVHWRSTARRGELMVRELESSELLRGAGLCVSVTLADDIDRADETASYAAGVAIAALDAGLRVTLLTHEAGGPRAAEVRTRREVGRRLAAAIPGPPAAADTTRARVVEAGP
jgi:uncharacterized protein (DUF58 family)